MRLKPSNSAFLIAVSFVLLTTISVAAQEDSRGGQGDVDAQPAVRTETEPSISESEGRGSSKPITTVKETQKDTAQVKVIKPTKAAEKTPEKGQKEEDPLSFNFLYYIIEKFKMSDIIE